MPITYPYDEVPAGYTAEAVAEGDTAKVISREFVSSDDPQLLISRLEGYPSILLRRVPPYGVDPSEVSRMLAVIRRDKTVTLYLNEELDLRSVVRLKRAVGAGQPVYEDDVADIESVSFFNIDIPPDAGIVLVFSVGWRRGLFYDFVPLADEGELRNYDLERVVANYTTYLKYQHLFQLSDDEVDYMLEKQWFPFITLKKATLKKLIEAIRDRGNPDYLVPRLVEQVNAEAASMLERWKNNPPITPHIELLKTAIERFREGDYVSAASIIYPRIEGVMREIHGSSGKGGRPTQSTLVDSVFEAKRALWSEYSLLLPTLFYRYLKAVYFAPFEPGAPSPLSRNSISHGVASSTTFDSKAAAMGLLTLDQIFYYLPVAVGPTNGRVQSDDDDDASS